VPKVANPNLRQDILATALRLLDDKGAARFTMREVAGVLGYSATAIYQHFASRRELLVALRLHIASLLASEMEEARTAPRLERQVRTMAARYLRFGLQNPAAYRLLFQAAIPDTTLTPEQMHRIQRSWWPVRETLEAWLNTRHIRSIDVERETYAGWALMHGITSLAIANRLQTRDQAEVFALLDFAVGRWMNGILRNGQRPPGKLIGISKPKRNTKKRLTRNQES
jgi:AcrR family transcriptional regulator